MFCKNCGNALSDEAVVCPHCGIQVGELKSYANMNTVQQPNNNVAKKDNTIAIVGFIMSFFIPLAGLICSIIGYKNAKKFGSDHRGLALAGIIISAITIGVVVIYLIVLLFMLFGLMIGVGTVYPGIGQFVMSF